LLKQEKAAMPRANVRLNLPAIEASLREVQQEFAAINTSLLEPRDDLTDRIVDNMMAGYRLVEQYANTGDDLFAMDQVAHLLEINNTVLCGTDADRRREFASHIAATEQHFYEEQDGGIGDLLEWYAVHRAENAWKRAAGVFVRILSKPQLFLEGNHRSGALIMSYILLRDALPPFVLTRANARAHFNPSAVIRRTGKKGLGMLYRMPKIKKRYAEFLKAQSDSRFLLTDQSA
jgi:hypothetical protein